MDDLRGQVKVLKLGYNSLHTHTSLNLTVGHYLLKQLRVQPMGWLGTRPRSCLRTCNVQPIWLFAPLPSALLLLPGVRYRHRKEMNAKDSGDMGM